MRLRKKVLLTALALTLTSTNSFTKDISFAAEEDSNPEEVVIENDGSELGLQKDNKDLNVEKNLKSTTEFRYRDNIDISSVKGIVEVLKDELKELLYNNEFENSLQDNPNKVLDNLDLYKETYKSVSFLKEENNIENSEKYKDELIKLILIKENLVADKNKIDNLLANQTENDDLQKNSLINTKEQLTTILNTLENVKLISEDENEVITSIDNGESHKNYLSQKQQLKNELSLLINDIEEKLNSLKKDDLEKINLDLVVAKNLMAETNATKNELQISKDKLNLILEILDKKSDSKDTLTNSKDILTKKIDELKLKINDKENKKYLPKKFYDNSMEKIVSIEKEMENADEDKLNQYLQDLILIDKNIDKIKENLSKLEKEIEKANSNKKTQAYYRASAPKRNNYVKSISQAENYLESVLGKESDNPETYNNKEVDKYIKGLTDAYNKLDGLSYENLLQKSKKKFEMNKRHLSEKSVAELQNQLNLISDMKNNANTVDVVNDFSDLIDKKVEADKKNTPKSIVKNSSDSSKKGQINVKKVAVPRAVNKGRIKAKSIVRTGIDSVKIFGLVAIVAVVLLLLTKKRKDN